MGPFITDRAEERVGCRPGRARGPGKGCRYAAGARERPAACARARCRAPAVGGVWSAGRTAASACASQFSRRPGLPCRPAATAAPRRSSACSSTGSCAGGHDVTLFASGDSRTEASLVSTFAESRSDDLGLTQPELLHALTCVHDAHAFDVVSDHTGALGLALSNLTSTPFLNTVHGTLAGEAGALYRRVCEVTPGAALVSLTESHRSTARDLPWTATIPNAIALDDHPCRAEQGRRVPVLARPHVGGQGPGDRDRGRARLRHAACCSPASCAARPSRRTSRRKCSRCSAAASSTSARSTCRSACACCTAHERSSTRWPGTSRSGS